VLIKYLRIKGGLTLAKVAGSIGLSKSYLSALENGVKPLSQDLRSRLMQIYGYNPSSFKNFTTEDKRGKNIPIRYKLDLLLRQLDESKVEKIFNYAIQNVAQS